MIGIYAHSSNPHSGPVQAVRSVCVCVCGLRIFQRMVREGEGSVCTLSWHAASLSVSHYHCAYVCVCECVCISVYVCV